MPVRIVVDSSAGVPDEVVKELGITVVDLHLVDKETETTTSGLSSLELAAAYARQLERGGDDGVVALHVGKELSSTYSAAVAASAVFDGAVRVIDTASVGMAVGAAAMAAAKLAQEGADLDACEKLASDTLRRSSTWVYLQKIDDLRKSGRLSTGTAIMSAAVLAIKPIMEIRDGKLELAGKTRTQAKAFSKVAELVVERAAGDPVFVAVQHVDTEQAALQLRDLLEEVLPEGSSFMLAPLSPVLRVHTGAGAIGVSAVFSTAPDVGDGD